jgi:hypothetical protein
MKVIRSGSGSRTLDTITTGAWAKNILPLCGIAPRVLSILQKIPSRAPGVAEKRPGPQ